MTFNSKNDHLKAESMRAKFKKNVDREKEAEIAGALWEKILV